MEPITIKLKYFEDAMELNKIEKGDWIDLYSREYKIINEGEEAKIKLGIAMELPKGYEAHLVPRSSTFKNWGIIMTNSMGIIDNSYSGDDDEWSFPAYCLIGRDFVNGKRCTIIKKGDKICQFRIVENMPEIRFEKVDKLNNPSRGGYGTTGTR